MYRQGCGEKELYRTVMFAFFSARTMALMPEDFLMQDKKEKTNQAKTLFSECSEEEKNKTISFLLGDRGAFEEPVSHKLCLLPERR